MMYTILSYIKYKLTAKNQHSVHSPFVYDLVTTCLYDSKVYPAYKKFVAYRSSLLASEDTIQVTDLGEGGSRGTEERKVKDITKIAASLNKGQQLMYRLVKHLGATSCLELGTSLGNATYAMALANKKGTITTIEGCPNISKYTEQLFKDNAINNVTFLDGDFKHVLPSLEASEYDLIFFDGNHNKEATLSYFETMLSKAHNKSVFIFDDIYWSKGMTEAWEIIKGHPKVTVTIDIFFWGLVFFRKEQGKEHFKIRL